MNIYILSASKSGKDNIDGTYYLMTEEGEFLASHFCSNKHYAYGDLYGDRSNRINEYDERFGSVEVLWLGDDEMTKERLLKLNKEHAIANGYYKDKK